MDLQDLFYRKFIVHEKSGKMRNRTKRDLSTEREGGRDTKTPTPFSVIFENINESRKYTKLKKCWG